MVVIFILLIGLSGLFSSAETAFMSVSKIRVKTVSEDEEDPHHAKALIVSQLLEDTDHLLSTILVGNNLVNILASSLTTSLTKLSTLLIFSILFLFSTIFTFIS